MISAISKAQHIGKHIRLFIMIFKLHNFHSYATKAFTYEYLNKFYTQQQKAIYLYTYYTYGWQKNTCITFGLHPQRHTRHTTTFFKDFFQFLYWDNVGMPRFSPRGLESPL